MYTFTTHYNEITLERACDQYSDIQKTYDGEAGKIWTMTAHFWNNVHEVKVIQGVSGDYKYTIPGQNGNFVCRFDGDSITLISGEYNGRKCKSEKTLKKFENVAMLLFALVKCEKLN